MQLIGSKQKNELKDKSGMEKCSDGRNAHTIPEEEMRTTRMETNVSSQTDDFKCSQCEKYLEKYKYMDITIWEEHDAWTETLYLELFSVQV